MKFKLSKSQWEEMGNKAGWIKTAQVKEIGSQRREKIENSDMEIATRISPTEVILKYKDDDKLPHELWILRDDFAGYVIEIDGKGYEFVRQVKTPYVVQ